MASLAETLRQAGYVTPQGVTGPNAPLAKQLKNYVTNVIPTAAQNLAQQRADIDAGLTMGDQGIQIGDREAFERQMAQVPNLMGATAYHGTPHTIKGKFDISKVGTGEGAQAYGHGMYFAESKDIADVYRKKLTNEAGNAVTDPNNSIQLQIGRLEDQIKQLKQSDDPNAGPMIKAYQSRIDEINKVGNLYKVDIPDADIPMMLDWDKPLSQQPKEILDKLPKNWLSNAEMYGNTGKGLYDWLIDITNSQAKASQMMNEIGIKGIRYLDEGSRSLGKGTSNFVVFEPSNVKILEQNSKPMTRKEILEQELKKVVE
jgi:hypothetical protein